MEVLSHLHENQSVLNKPLFLRQLIECVKYHSGNSIREIDSEKTKTNDLSLRVNKEKST